MNPTASAGTADSDLPPDRLITVPEVANLLSVSERHVRALVARGALPVIHLGKSVRFSRAHLAAWIDHQLVSE